MSHHCVHHPATTRDAAAAIAPVVADESLELEPDHSSQCTFTARPPPQPGIDSLAVISAGTCCQLCVDSLLVSMLVGWW